MAHKKKKARGPQNTQPQPDALRAREASPARSQRARVIGGAVLVLLVLAAGIYTQREFFANFFRQPQVSLAPASSTKINANSAAVTFDDFVGAEACQACHAEQYELWRKSTHGNAGGTPASAQVIAKFNGEPMHFKDAEVLPLQRDGAYVFLVKPQGQPEREIRVAAIVGGGHMNGGGTQSFFGEFPDGTLKFLPFDFIRAENTWFVQLREHNDWAPVSRDIALSDLAHWPPHRILGTAMEFSNCQNCHGSQILVQYDATSRRYVTRFQTLQINCESCHGPGRRHVALMQAPHAEQREDIGMAPLATLSKDASLQVCWQCHATKDVMQANYLPGKNFEEHYALKFPILGSAPYLPDGRVRAFAYQENHLYSACYLNGSMTCVDCHDPHAQTYREVWSKPLAGRFANEQCTACHASKARNVERHSHHRAGSSGSVCVACHMPYLQHHAVGNKLRFARSDHSIPIPRPAFDAQLGIENACSKCHREQNVAALQRQVEKWYGQLKPHHPQVARFLQAQNVNDFARAAALLLGEAPAHPIAQVANLNRFVQNYAQPDMLPFDAAVGAQLERLAASEDLEVQALALMALHYIAGDVPEVRAFLAQQLHAAGARETALRRRWAIAMDFLGVVWASERRDYAKAMAAHRKALEIVPDDEVTLTNLVQACHYRGEYEEAIRALEAGLRFHPQSGNLYALLAQSYMGAQNNSAAREAVANGLRYAPEHADLKRLAEQLAVSGAR